jgi:hypothetical protein
MSCGVVKRPLSRRWNLEMAEMKTLLNSKATHITRHLPQAKRRLESKMLCNHYEKMLSIGWCKLVTLGLPPTTMANLEIFFFLLGDSSPSNDTFPITASPGISVSELKEKVYAEKQNGLKGIDASDLCLWKVLPLSFFHRIMC